MAESFKTEQYRASLTTSWLGAELIYKPRLPSTNSYLKKLDHSEFSHGTVLITDHQTDGRAQYEKKWFVEKNKNLTFTLGFKPLDSSRLPLLTLSCALAIVQTLKSHNIQGIHIKWPNDVLIGDKKAAGILTECIFIGSKVDRVLIGIGLNVNQKSFDQNIRGIATSLALEAGKNFDREPLLCQILGEIEYYYHRWHRKDTTLSKEINSRMIGFGDWVDVSVNGTLKEEKCKFLGINEKGQCVMLNEDLDVNTFSYEQIRIFSGRYKIPGKH